MIDDFFKMFGGVIEYSQELQSKTKKGGASWKHCAALHACGWKIIGFTRQPDSHNALVRWAKEGQKDIEFLLTFSEQCLWVEYMGRKNNVK